MENNPNANQIMAAPAKVKITAKSFAAKFKSKREVYNFLSVDVGLYLPAYGKYNRYQPLTSSFHHIDQVTIYFLKDLMSGKKKSKFKLYYV